MTKKSRKKTTSKKRSNAGDGPLIKAIYVICPIVMIISGAYIFEPQISNMMGTPFRVPFISDLFDGGDDGEGDFTTQESSPKKLQSSLPKLSSRTIEKDSEKAGVIHTIEGIVEVETAPGKRYQAATNAMLTKGDVLNCQDNAKIQIVFPMGMTIYLSDGCQFELHQYTRGSRASTLIAAVHAGNAHVVTAPSKLRRNTRFLIEGAVLSPVGTNFIIENAGQNSKISTIDGKVRFTQLPAIDGMKKQFKLATHKKIFRYATLITKGKSVAVPPPKTGNFSSLSQRKLLQRTLSHNKRNRPKPKRFKKNQLTNVLSKIHDNNYQPLKDIEQRKNSFGKIAKPAKKKRRKRGRRKRGRRGRRSRRR